jgi:TrmH RNA methyltransferase
MSKPPPRKLSLRKSQRPGRDSESARRARDTPAPDRRPSRDSARKEIKYHGANACLALWKRRPDDIVRIYVAQSRVPQFGEMLKWAAGERKAYHVVENDDLERLTETTHHGGICVLAREPEELTFAELRRALQENAAPQLLLYLDGVENPHNFGAILRAAAHFGVSHVLGAANELPRVSPSACRVAEGAAEYVRIARLHRGAAELKQLREDGFTLVGTHVQRGRDVYRYEFPPRCVLVLGAEEHGMSPKMREAVDVTVRIPGAGAVESLNVASACAVLASEYYRRNLEPAPERGTSRAEPPVELD